MKHIIYLLLLLTTPFVAFSNVLNIQQWKTANGVHVYFVQAMQVPMVDIKFAFKAGSAYDAKQWGIATLTNELLDQAAGGLNATEIAEKLENNGAQFSSTVNRDMATVSIRTLSADKNLSPSLAIFKTILAQPDFDGASIKRAKSQLVTAIKHSQEVPQSVAANAFYQTLYGTHPYAHSPLGTIKTVDAINSNNIKQFYQTHYVANSAVLSIVGAVSTKKAKTIAEQLSADLLLQKIPLSIPEAQGTHYKKDSIAFPSNQSIIRIGQIGIDYHNKHRFPLIVGNYTLGGGGLVSRLADEIREKRGLSYGISSYFLPLKARGPFIVSLATKTKQTDTALSVTHNTLKGFVDKGPSDTELVAAKKYINGSFPLRFSSNANVLNTLLLIGFYELPSDYLDTYLTKINKVTKKDIQDAFHAQVNVDNLLTIVVGKT